MTGDRLRFDLVDDTCPDYQGTPDAAIMAGLYAALPFQRVEEWSTVGRRLALRPRRCCQLAACEGSDAPDPTETAPSLAETECPPQVDDVPMGDYSCAILTTSERDDSPPVELLVTTVEPEGGALSDDPLIVVGADLASELYYAGLAPAPTGSNGRS